MLSPDPHNIRRIFLTPRPNVALFTAADLLGTTLAELKRDIDDGVIVAVSTALGPRVSKEELIATAMRLWEQSVIEDALGEDAAALLPEAIRLVELRARIPRYQRDVLRELEDVASAHAEELASALPGLAEALGWPESCAACGRALSVVG